jgi:hypothetical protein
MTDLMEVRTALTSTSNNDWSAGTALGGAEINKVVDKMIVDSINRNVDLRPLVSRKPMDQLAYIWNLRKDLGSTGKADFYSEGATGTPYPSTKTQLYATAFGLRSDYEVTGLMIAASRSYFDALQDEAQDAIDALKIKEEKQMICGTVTGSYGDSGGYLGLGNLMLWKNSNGGDYDATAANLIGDVTSVYGLTRDSASADPPTGHWELDTSYVVAGTAGTATGVLELKHLDEAIDRSDKHGGKGDERVFFVSVERGSEINRLLQPQQRFAGTLKLEGGFSIATYKGVPIVTSRFMDKSGVTNTGSKDLNTDADNAMYLLDLKEIEFRVLAGVDVKHVPIMGDDASIRKDVRGGYFKSYGTFVMKNFIKQVNIWNLTAPA